MIEFYTQPLINLFLSFIPTHSSSLLFTPFRTFPVITRILDTLSQGRRLIDVTFKTRLGYVN